MLSDAEARAAYDSARSAALLREAQRHAMDAKRRAMIEDLEARERGIKRPRHGDHTPDGKNENAMSEQEKQRLIAAGRKRREEKERLMKEAEERERLRELERQKQATEHKPPTPDPPSPQHISTTTTDGGAAGFKSDIPMADAAGGDEGGDDYDARIADIERRLQERQAKRAARKEAKKSKKAQDDGRRGVEEAEAQDIPSTSQNPGITESKADDQKARPPASAPSEPKPKPPSAEGTRPPRVPGDFSSTMARLRTAQAAKDAKKKAEQEVAAAAGAGSSSVSQVPG